MHFDRGQRSVGRGHRRRAHVVSLLDVVETNGRRDRDGDVVGYLDLDVFAVTRLHRQHVALDLGDRAP